MKKTFLTILSLFVCLSLMSQDIAPNERVGTDWEVEVTLSSGSKISGIVIANHFIEKAKYGHVYQEISNINEPGAGVRVWYVRENPGFVFISYKDITSIKKLGRVSTQRREQLENAIRTRIDQTTRSSQEQEEKLRQAGIVLTEEDEQFRENKRNREIEELARAKINRSAIMSRLSAQAQNLLIEFPEEQGWSAEMYEKIKPRVLRAKGRSEYRGLPISYRRFYENYEQWAIAIELYKKEEAAILREIREKIAKEYDKKEALALKSKKEALGETKTEESSKVSDAIEDIEQKNIIQESIQIIMNSNNEKEKLAAIEELAQAGPQASPSVHTLKFAALKDSSVLVRQAAIRAMARIKEPQNIILDTLAEAIELGDLVVRREAATAFYAYGKNAISKFSVIASVATIDEDPKVRYFMVRTLETMGEPRAISYLQKRLWDDDPSVQVAAVSGLIMLMSSMEDIDVWGREILLTGLKHSDEKISILSSECLKKLSTGVNQEEGIQTLKQDIENIIDNYQGEIKDNLQDAITILNTKIKDVTVQPADNKEETSQDQENNEGSGEFIPSEPTEEEDEEPIY